LNYEQNPGSTPDFKFMGPGTTTEVIRLLRRSASVICGRNIKAATSKEGRR
jgi:hypothetical protein